MRNQLILSGTALITRDTHAHGRVTILLYGFCGSDYTDPCGGRPDGTKRNSGEALVPLDWNLEPLFQS